MKTSEGLCIASYIEKRNLNASFKYSKNQWGSNGTGIWTGTVGEVERDESDLGISFMSYTVERAAVVKYSQILGDNIIVWISKFPKKTASLFNVVQVFDFYSWCAIPISFLGVGIALLLIYHPIEINGIKKPDTVLVLLLPTDTWFKEEQAKVISGSIVVMVWGLSSLFIMLAFSCNLRAILLSPSYESPIDTSKDIVQKNMISVLSGSAWHYNYLFTSQDPWQRRILDNYKFKDTTLSFDSLLWNVYANENEVIPAGKDRVLVNMQNNKTFSDMNTAVFYFSKEELMAYFAGWVFQKETKWEDDVNDHILLCHQAGFSEKIANLYSSINVLDSSIPPEKNLAISDLAIPFILLCGGLALSGIVFILESCLKRK
ncbi:glutamate receptor ionotropic, delta-2 [Eurytemora carolleeae]|uniref:glutamate receptor ionotropic, delta-2 n=1 Tax=Eurytemora carolleeae TaxID=1294199 RepID=UPI000C78E49C|nr:glutamate receptor ionotropic, delta-2 [Eurytemora carolleeae]|eukprot:XP_023331676.1 glutamate receptor ionotropic, delta-2-like [Eurytemora affinis]